MLFKDECTSWQEQQGAHRRNELGMSDGGAIDGSEEQGDVETKKDAGGQNSDPRLTRGQGKARSGAMSEEYDPP